MKNGKMILLGVFALIAAVSLMGVLIQGCAKTPDAPTEPTVPTDPSSPTTAGVIKPNVAENSTGAKLWAQFQQELTKNPDATPKEIADVLVGLMANDFMGEATPIEKDAEYLAGFDNYRVTGYRDGAMYGPVIGSIAFIGYVFELEDGTDPAAFVKSLTDNCNPRWNICVTAEQTACGAVGNRVFFLMCP